MWDQGLKRWDQGSQVKYRRDQYHFGPIKRGPKILNHV